MGEKEGNWFKRHKVLTVILVLLAIIIVAGASGANKSSTGNSSGNENSKNKTYRFDDRADKQEKDVEITVNEPATIDGMKMTITKIEKKTAIGEFDKADPDKTYVIADVALENVGEKTKSYNTFDFRIQTVGGQVLDGAFAMGVEKPLSSGDLVAGGKINGQVVFEVPVEESNQYIIWKPNAWNSDRAIVQVTK